jgi:hypothetical protein
MDILNEATKEVLFGGVAGLAAGYLSKKVGNQLVGILLGKEKMFGDLSGNQLVGILLSKDKMFGVLSKKFGQSAGRHFIR